MKCPWCDKEISGDSEFCPECGVELNPTNEEKDETDERLASLDCLRCDGLLESLGIHKIQLGEHGFLFGDLSHLLSGALKVEIYRCDKCGKIEFFSPKED